MRTSLIAVFLVLGMGTWSGAHSKEEPLPKDITSLAKLLSEENPGGNLPPVPSARAQAAKAALIKLGEKAVPDLLEVLRNPKLNRMALAALGEIGPPAKAALPALVALLKEDDAEADLAAGAIHKIGLPDNAVVPLLALLERQCKKVIYHTPTGAMSALRHPKAVPALIEAFRRPIQSDKVRDFLGRILVGIGPEAQQRALPAFVAAMKSKRARTRRSGAMLLMSLRKEAEPAIPDLVFALKDTDQTTRLWAALALKGLGPLARKAAPALEELLEERDRRLRWTAASALWSVTGEKKLVLPVLLAMLQEAVGEKNKIMRMSIIQTFCEMGPAAAAAVPILIVTLRSDSFPENRLVAARALGEIGPAAKDALTVLRQATEDTGTLGEAAREALVKIQGNKKQ